MVFKLLLIPYRLVEKIAGLVESFVPKVVRLVLAMLGVVWLMSLSVSLVLELGPGLGGGGGAGGCSGSSEEGSPASSCNPEKTSGEAANQENPTPTELRSADVRIVANRQQYYVSVVTPSGESTLAHSDALDEQQLKEFLAETSVDFKFRRVVLEISASYSAMLPAKLFEMIRGWGYNVQLDTSADG